MTPEWVAFAVGVFLGVPAGVILAAILAAGAREDVAREAYAQGERDAQARASHKVAP